MIPIATNELARLSHFGWLTNTDCPQMGNGGWHSDDFVEGDGPCKWCGKEPSEDTQLAELRE